jgi:hypothetical protein
VVSLHASQRRLFGGCEAPFRMCELDRQNPPSGWLACRLPMIASGKCTTKCWQFWGDSKDSL